MSTTTGTGSEVTCWATVWDMEAQKKYSLTRHVLYPEHAIIDPALTLGISKDLAISTALDALSHALESLRNRSSNPVSTNHAVVAATEIIAALPLLADDLMPTSYASVVKGLLGKFVDVAVLRPYFYVIANDKDESVEVFAT